MTKQEQIEEMCEAIASMICEIYNPECDEYKPHTCSHCYANSTLIGDFAEMLIDAGYGKVDEVRKETAKEILQTLYDECSEITDETGEGMGYFVIDDEILCLAKQYGVEVNI